MEWKREVEKVGCFLIILLLFTFYIAGSRRMKIARRARKHVFAPILAVSIKPTTGDLPLKKDIQIMSQRKVYLGADLGLQIISRDGP